MKIGIIGTGAYSIGIALNLAKRKDNKIMLWSENKALVDEFQNSGKVKDIYDKNLPKNIDITSIIGEATKDADALFILTSTKYLREVASNINGLVATDVPIVVGSKGIDEFGSFAYDIVNNELANEVLYICGPTFAKDLMSDAIVGFNIYSKNKNTFKLIKSLFDENTTHLNVTKDLKGLELSSILKNIYAIGSGILDNPSTNALYLTYVYNEIYEILYNFKSSLDTLLGISCFGDLILTCMSNNSRNYEYGVLLNGNKKNLKKFLSENTVEGKESIESMYKLIHHRHIKTPILKTLYDIVVNDQEAKTLKELLLKF